MRTAAGRYSTGTKRTDPHFKDYLWFHEYFDGDDGRGLGASHQTGWTGLIANLIDELYAGQSLRMREMVLGGRLEAPSIREGEDGDGNDCFGIQSRPARL